MKILQAIVHSSNECDRCIIFIYGMPFYQSSGLSSDCPNTWFPFFGIKDIFLKANVSKLPQNVKAKLYQHFPKSPYFSNRMLELRLFSLPALLISSKLGGGIWDEAGGRLLKAYLQETYSEFYAQIPEITIQTVSHSDENGLGDDEIVNNWLLKQANVQTLKEIKDQFTNELSELLVKMAEPKPNQQEVGAGSQNINNNSGFSNNNVENLSGSVGTIHSTPITLATVSAGPNYTPMAAGSKKRASDNNTANPIVKHLDQTEDKRRDCVLQ